jgi:hypothetical protein
MILARTDHPCLRVGCHRRVADRSWVNHSGTTSDDSPRNATNSRWSVTPTSSQHSGLAQAVGPYCTNSAVTSQRPRRSCLASPPGMLLVKRRSGSSSFRAMGQWSQVAAVGHHPKLSEKAVGEALMAPKRAKVAPPVGHDYY